MRQSNMEILVCVMSLVCLAACSEQQRNDAAANQPPVPGKLSISTTPVSADTDVAVKGGSLPNGYVARPDDAAASMGDASYKVDGTGRWEVRTGPAHILYTARDTARKAYTVTATFEQLDAPVHPEAFGVFLGGMALDTPAKQQYTYFLMRGDGKYMVKVRNGAETRVVTDWTPHPAISVQTAAGKGVYGVRIDVAGKVAKVSVNGQPVTMFSGPRVPMEGVTGIRINHNLHLMVTPAVVTRHK